MNVVRKAEMVFLLFLLNPIYASKIPLPKPEKHYSVSLSSPKNIVSTLTVVNNKELWTGSIGGIVVYDLNSGKKTKEYTYPQIPDNDVTVLINMNGRIFAGTYNGVGVYDVLKKKWNHLKNLSGKTILSGVADKTNKLLWLGTYQNGLIKTTLNGRIIENFKQINGRQLGIIFSLAADDQELWVGTSKGLFIYRFSSNSWMHLSESDGLPYHVITSIMLDKDYAWIGSLVGISKLDRRTKKATKWSTFLYPTDDNKSFTRAENLPIGSTYREFRPTYNWIKDICKANNFIIVATKVRGIRIYDESKSRWLLGSFLGHCKITTMKTINEKVYLAPMPFGIDYAGVDRYSLKEILSYITYIDKTNRSKQISTIPSSKINTLLSPSERIIDAFDMDCLGKATSLDGENTSCYIRKGEKMYIRFPSTEKDILLKFRGVNDNNFDEPPKLLFTLNGSPLLRCISPFNRCKYDHKDDEWTTFTIYIPHVLLQTKNTLCIENITGPGWWAVDYVTYRSIRKNKTEISKTIKKEINIGELGTLSVGFDINSIKFELNLEHLPYSKLQCVIKPLCNQSNQVEFNIFPSGKLFVLGWKKWKPHYELTMQKLTNKWKYKLTIPYSVFGNLDINAAYKYYNKKRMFIPIGIGWWIEARIQNKILCEKVIRVSTYSVFKGGYQPITILDTDKITSYTKYGKNYLRIKVNYLPPNSDNAHIDIFSQTKLKESLVGTLRIRQNMISKITNIEYLIIPTPNSPIPNNLVVRFVCKNNQLVQEETISLNLPYFLLIKPNKSYYTIEKSAYIYLLFNAENVIHTPLENLLINFTLRTTPSAFKIQNIYSFDLSQSKSFSIPFKIGTLPIGKHHIEIKVFSKENKLITKKTLNIQKLKPNLSEVKIDDKNNIIANGKPTFLLGCWLPKWQYLIIPRAKRWGLNSVVIWQADKIPLENIVGLMERYKMFYLLDNFSVKSAPIKIAQKIKEKYSNRKHLIGYLTADEPEYHGKPTSPERMKKIYQAFKLTDPYHPVILNHHAPSAYKRYLDSSDIVSYDPYPIPDTPISIVANYIDLCRKVTSDQKPILLTEQLFAWNGKRFPTMEEFRCMAYLAIIHGAKGVIYFASIEDTLPILGTTFTELKKLAPILTSPQQPITASTAPPYVQQDTMIKIHNKYLYLFAVNRNPKRISVTFTLPQHICTENVGNVMFEDKKIILHKNHFQDIFLPYSVHIYRIKLTTPLSIGD